MEELEPSEVGSVSMRSTHSSTEIKDAEGRRVSVESDDSGRGEGGGRS